MVKLNEIIEWASPVLISPRKMSLTISLSNPHDKWNWHHLWFCK